MPNSYGLALNERVYVYDYRRGEWLFWDDIPASAFANYGERLYFGSAAEGKIYRFCRESDDDPFLDGGRDFEAHWQSKDTSLGSGTIYKLIKRLALTINAQGGSNKAELSFADDRRAARGLAPCYWRLAALDGLDFGDFSFITSALPKLFIRRLQAKRVLYCHLRAESNEGGQGMAISRLSFFYNLEKPALR